MVGHPFFGLVPARRKRECVHVLLARLLHITGNRTPRGGVYMFMILITSSGVDHLIKEQQSLGLPKK